MTTGKSRVWMNLVGAWLLANASVLHDAIGDVNLDARGWGQVIVALTVSAFGVWRAWATDTFQDAEVTAAKKEAEHKEAMAEAKK